MNLDTSDRAVTSNAAEVLNDLVDELAGLIEHLSMTCDLMRVAVTDEEQQGYLWRALNEGAPHLAALVQAWADLHLYAAPGWDQDSRDHEAVRTNLNANYNRMIEPLRRLSDKFAKQSGEDNCDQD